MKWSYNVAQALAAAEFIRDNNTAINWDVCPATPYELVMDLVLRLAHTESDGTESIGTAGVYVTKSYDTDSSGTIEIYVNPNVGSDKYHWQEIK